LASFRPFLANQEKDNISLQVMQLLPTNARY